MHKRLIITLVASICLLNVYAEESSVYKLFVMNPGNPPQEFTLTANDEGKAGTIYTAPGCPVTVRVKQKTDNGHTLLDLSITSSEETYFNFGMLYDTGIPVSRAQMLMPGFWYRKNLRSPDKAPSAHTSDSWTVREDRLSTPLTAVFDSLNGNYMSVIRLDKYENECLAPLNKGDFILGGKSSIGYTGFRNVDGIYSLDFGYPYAESPKSYIRKLTLADEARSYARINKGETINLKWELTMGTAKDFSALVRDIWEYSYDMYKPTPVGNTFDDEFMKKTLAEFFRHSYVEDRELKYTSGIHLYTADCIPNGQTEVGFIGRVLLNAFNAIEYGEQTGDTQLIEQGYSIFDSYLRKGFNEGGFFREFVNFDRGIEEERMSIRRQSEGAYAVFHFMQYQKKKGADVSEWEKKIRSLLDTFISLQNADGSFPRKFKADKTIADASGGSTPSATLPLVMGYKYFKDRKYLDAAKKSALYLEKQIIDKADYFSSTLDANCEDKEAALYATTAMYYLALVTKGKEAEQYKSLALKSSYFALSWYYLWDVPFAPGQMLGDIGLKTRGWGNVSVENNHIDVYIFELCTVLDWLGAEYNMPRFNAFTQVIRTSMRQLLPFEGHLCGVARTGYYPEVVQHTTWDYGRNGKGFYNNIFAPGWTVASLWEMMSPDRARIFLTGK